MTGLVLAASLGWALGQLAFGAQSALAYTDGCDVEADQYLGSGNTTLYDSSDGDEDEWNNWFGEGGDDSLHSEQCSDGVNGGSGADNLYAGGSTEDPGAFDGVEGLNGADFIDGGSGDDTLDGGSGDDVIYDYVHGSDLDHMYGGPDDDVLDTDDGDGQDATWGEGGTLDICRTNGGDLEYPSCEF